VGTTLQVCGQALQPVADALTDLVPNLRKYRDCGYSKDKLNHEHFGKKWRSGTALDHCDVAVAVMAKDVGQLALTQTETAPKNTHQVSVSWWLVPQFARCYRFSLRLTEKRKQK
jgi:hypothetical protein